MEKAGAVQSCRPSVSEHWNPQSFFPPRYAEHQQLYIHATLTHHHPSPGRRSGNSSLENLNSPKEKTVTFLIFGFPPSASLPPHPPRVKSANRETPISILIHRATHRLSNPIIRQEWTTQPGSLTRAINVERLNSNSRKKETDITQEAKTRKKVHLVSFLNNTDIAYKKTRRDYKREVIK